MEANQPNRRWEGVSGADPLRPIGRRAAAAPRLLDAAAVGLGLWAAYALRGLHDPERYALAGALAVLLYLLAGGGAARRAPETPAADIPAALGAWAAALAGLLAAAWMTKSTADYSRIAVGLWAILGTLGLAGWRLAAHLARGRRNAPPAAIAGTGPEAARFARFLLSAAGPRRRVEGFFAEGADAARAEGLPGPVLGDLDELAERAARREVATVFVALSPDSGRRAGELVAALAETPATVYVVPAPAAEELVHARWVSLHGTPLVSVFESPFEGVNGWIKRVEDLLLASAALALAAAPMLLIAGAVRLTSPGPAIFRQRRRGIDGREIVIYKFRTMTVREDGGDVRHAVPGDPRVTRVGAFLRRTSLDELPQFLNVLRGEMSVVGPRPHAVAIDERFRRLVPGYMLRHRVKPGITGWAQIHGLRGAESVEHMRERIRHDLWYLGRWSLWLDLVIVARTAALLAGDRRAV